MIWELYSSKKKKKFNTFFAKVIISVIDIKKIKI